MLNASYASLARPVAYPFAPHKFPFKAPKFRFAFIFVFSFCLPSTTWTDSVPLGHLLEDVTLGTLGQYDFRLANVQVRGVHRQPPEHQVVQQEFATSISAANIMAATHSIIK